MLGSLFAHSRHPEPSADGPYGLDFLEPAISDFVEESRSLLVNTQGIRQLSQSISEFNEAFASWLYIMDMNALTTDWPQVRFV
jgi:DASH complex subunit DAM1